MVQEAGSRPKALIAGETNPERLLQHTTGLLKTPRERLLEGLRGIVTDHHRFMLRLHLRQIEALEAGVAQLERQITKLVRPVQSRVDLLTTIPGVSDTVAHVLVAEIGMDMARFPTPGHLVSWAGLCPRLDESAGKARSTRVRHGAPWLKTTRSAPAGRPPLPVAHISERSSSDSRLVAGRRRPWSRSRPRS